MPTVEKGDLTMLGGRYCEMLGPWFDSNFGESADESAMVQKAAEDGYVDAVVEYIRTVLLEEDTPGRCVLALASLPATEDDAWKSIVDEANEPTPDVQKIRSLSSGWPHDNHFARQAVSIAKVAIETQEEAARPGHWVDFIEAARSA